MKIGNVTLDSKARVAAVNGVDSELTGKEFQILELLALNRGDVQSKSAMLTYLYGGEAEPDSKILDVFVCKLRRKLRNVGAPDAVETVWGRGYRMN